MRDVPGAIEIFGPEFGIEPWLVAPQHLAARRKAEEFVGSPGFDVILYRNKHLFIAVVVQVYDLFSPCGLSGQILTQRSVKDVLPEHPFRVAHGDQGIAA